MPPKPAQTASLVRVACYARVSSEDQAERQTIAAQTDFLARYCDLHGLPVHDTYTDDGISGTVPLAERPAGRRLLEAAESGAFSVVLVYRLDRLGRSLSALLAAHDRLEASGVTIRSGTEPFDTATPIGRFLFSLLGSMAELERSTISERMTRGRDRVARGGRYTGGPIPTGYDLDEDRMLVPSARIVPQLGISEADMVREIFERIASGAATMMQECERLTKAGVPRRQRYGGARGVAVERTRGWEAGSLAKILHNPTYKGLSEIDSRHGRVERPCPPLVTPDTWERAQAALVRNRAEAKRNARHAYLLRGLARCQCGMSYVGSQSGRGPVYRCSSYATRHVTREGGPCIGGVVDAATLEDAVWARVRAFARDPGPYLEESRRRIRTRPDERGALEARSRRLANEIAAKGEERDRVVALFRRGRISTEEADREFDTIESEARQIEAQLAEVDARLAAARAEVVQFDSIGDLLADLRGKVELIDATDDRDAKRRQIAALTRRIEVHTEAVGRTARGRLRKRTSVYVLLALSEDVTIDSTMRRTGLGNISLEALTAEVEIPL